MTTCDALSCFATATGIADHPKHGKVHVCDEHAAQFDSVQEVLVA